MQRAWLYRIVILWALLFSFSALGSAILSAIVNVDWSKLNAQAKFIIFITVFVNWATVMMAFFSQAARKLEEGKLPINGTTIPSGSTETITKSEITSVQTQVKT